MSIKKLLLYMASCLSLLVVSDVSAQANSASTVYSLKTVESKPIPRKAHFALWKEVALSACTDAKSRFNLEQSECVSVISNRANMCIAKYEEQTPTVVHTTAESRSIGRNFMYCATPYYFCSGVEVKTEAEVRARCK